MTVVLLKCKFVSFWFDFHLFNVNFSNVSSFIDDAAVESDVGASPSDHGVMDEENSDDRAFINDAAVLTEERYVFFFYTSLSP
jgi:hypothetical protein